MKSLSFKKELYGQSDIHISIKYVFIFYKLLFEVKKIDVRLNKTMKLKFILIFLIVSIRHVLPTR